MKGTKEQKGITLIALIITIVVLLILAAVAISSIQENGILGYATNAADSWNIAQENEAETLQGYLDYLDSIGKPGAPTTINGISIVAGTETGKSSFTVQAVGGTNATGYQYSTDGTSWSETVTTNYTFSNLLPTTYASTNNTFTVYARAVDSNENTSNSTFLTIIAFYYNHALNNSVYYVKEGTTWRDFIANSFAGQTHAFGRYNYNTTSEVVGHKAWKDGDPTLGYVEEDIYAGTVCYCGVNQEFCCADGMIDTIYYDDIIAKGHYHYH